MSDAGCTCPDENTRLASCPRHNAAYFSTPALQQQQLDMNTLLQENQRLAARLTEAEEANRAAGPGPGLVPAIRLRIAERDAALQKLAEAERDRNQFYGRLAAANEHAALLEEALRPAREQLERLARIIEGFDPEAKLVPPHGQSSATPRALIDRIDRLLAGGVRGGEEQRT